VESVAKSAQEAVKSIRARDGKVEALAEENATEATLEDLETRIKELESEFKSWRDQH
jgi:prefoldin subunit 5